MGIANAENGEGICIEAKSDQRMVEIYLQLRSAQMLTFAKEVDGWMKDLPADSPLREKYKPVNLNWVM